MRAFILLFALLPIGTAAFAQETATGSDPSGQATGAIANPGQLDFGAGGSVGSSATLPSESGSITNPGQLDLGGRNASRTGGTGGMPSGGAGISTGAITIPMPAEDYTQPIYGNGMR